MSDPTPPPVALLPCPFCRSEARYEDSDWAHHVSCTGCDVFIGLTGKTKEQIVAAWNTRAALRPPETTERAACNSAALGPEPVVVDQHATVNAPARPSADDAAVLDDEAAVNKLLHEVAGGVFQATSRYYELHAAVLSRMSRPSEAEVRDRVIDEVIAIFKDAGDDLWYPSDIIDELHGLKLKTKEPTNG